MIMQQNVNNLYNKPLLVRFLRNENEVVRYKKKAACEHSALCCDILHVKICN